MASSIGRSAARPWHCTSDGILVLRYPRAWSGAADPLPVLIRRRNGDAGLAHQPVLFDLRRLDPGDPVGRLRTFLLGLPPLARRIPQRRAYLVRDAAQADLVSMIQIGTAPSRSEACVFREWMAALDWLRGSH